MAEDESNSISPGVKVWVPDPVEAYVSGSVVSVSGEAVKVATEKGEAELKHADLCLVEHADREDMVTLNYLHEPGVLHNLKNRYGLDEIYTYTGNILIAVRSGRHARDPRERTSRASTEPTDVSRLSKKTFSFAESETLVSRRALDDAEPSIPRADRSSVPQTHLCSCTNPLPARRTAGEPVPASAASV